MPPDELSAWERVGPMLAARRVQISPRYANRRVFARERGMGWRTLHDAELGKRGNFKTETRQAFESAYMLVPGSLDRTLAGGDLEPARPVPDRPRPHLAEVPPGGLDDALIERMVLNVIATSGDARPVMEAMWAGVHLPARTRLEKMLDYLHDDPSLPIDWDKDADGEDGQARA